MRHHKESKHSKKHSKHHSRKLLEKYSTATKTLMTELASRKWLKKASKGKKLEDKVENWHIKFQAVGEKKKHKKHSKKSLKQQEGSADDETAAEAEIKGILVEIKLSIPASQDYKALFELMEGLKEKDDEVTAALKAEGVEVTGDSHIEDVKVESNGSKLAWYQETWFLAVACVAGAILLTGAVFGICRLRSKAGEDDYAEVQN